jgi:hypothetical protein
MAPSPVWTFLLALMDLSFPAATEYTYSIGRPDVVAAGITSVNIITHSYGGPVARAYYLNPSNGAQSKVDQVISFGGGFLGVVEPFDILERGSTWDLGWSIGSLSAGIAEWETKALAQNWPTAYFQMPNSEDWFFDQNDSIPNRLGTPVFGKFVNRAFIRDRRPNMGDVTSYAASMAWIGLSPDSLANPTPRHNMGLTAFQMAFFSQASVLPVGMGNFSLGTGDIYHHRVIGKGRMDTTVALNIGWGPSEAGLHPLEYGIIDPISFGVENISTERITPVLGDGDSTVPYHGAIGLTDPFDDRVYIINGVVHGDLPNTPAVLGTSSTAPGLLQLLLNGLICSQPQSTGFLSQNQVTEVI